MIEYGSLLMGLAFGTVGFTAALLSIRRTEAKARKSAHAVGQQDFAFPTASSQDEESRRKALLFHR